MDRICCDEYHIDYRSRAGSILIIKVLRQMDPNPIAGEVDVLEQAGEPPTSLSKSEFPPNDSFYNYVCV
jgi:hypothetical protein